MDYKELQNHLDISRRIYFTDFFLLACMLIAIIACILFLKEEKYGFLFLVYSISAFTLMNDDYVLIFSNRAGLLEKFVLYGNLIFAYVELVVFSLFFRALFKSAIIKTITNTAIGLFSMALLFFFVYYLPGHRIHSEITKFSDFFISSELLYLFGFCLTYYYNLVRRSSDLLQQSSPSFWIVTGLFIYTLIIIPFFMLDTEIRNTSRKLDDIAYAIHYITFGFLFLAIAKALFIRKSLTQNMNSGDY